MRIRTLALFAVGGTGSVLIAAAQTPPKEAVSNIAGWFDMIGTAPDFLMTQSADHWATMLGFVLIAAPASYALWRRKIVKRRPPPSQNGDLILSAEQASLLERALRHPILRPFRTAGIAIMGKSSNVTVEDCDIVGFDDAIAVSDEATDVKIRRVQAKHRGDSDERNK